MAGTAQFLRQSGSTYFAVMNYGTFSLPFSAALTWIIREHLVGSRRADTVSGTSLLRHRLDH
jgi:hypothetical protein